MVILQNISYTHPNKDLLFSDINFTVNNHEKAALIGNNGAGKSTLLKIIAQELQPSNGQIALMLNHILFHKFLDNTIILPLQKR